MGGVEYGAPIGLTLAGRISMKVKCTNQKESPKESICHLDFFFWSDLLLLASFLDIKFVF